MGEIQTGFLVLDDFELVYESKGGILTSFERVVLDYILSIYYSIIMGHNVFSIGAIPSCRLSRETSRTIGTQ